MNPDFFILTAPRSGSTVLTRTLDQHPEIFCAGELFHPDDKIYHAEWHFPFWGRKKKKGFSRKIFAVSNYINGYIFAVRHIKKFYSTRERNKKLRGFKLMIGHIKDFPTAWRYLQKQNLKVIVLVRRNTFREALSSFRARQTGVFHTTEDSTIAKEKVHVNPSLFRKRVEALETLNRSILSLTEGMQRVVISYEEFDDWNNILNKVFDFLSAERIEMQPVLNKTSSENWREGVQNYKEIESVMQDKYAHYLD
jgi:LPS sulfotransferase NodH